MSPFSFANPNKNKLVALFDIGSGSVGGALVSISGQKNGSTLPTVLWSRRKEISFQQTVDPDQLIQLIFSTLKTLAQAISVETKEHPSIIFCTFSSPWYIAQTRIAKSSFAEPLVVIPPIINSLVDAEKAAFQTEYLPRAHHTESNRAVLLEQKIMRVRLNGYVTQKPYAKRAQDIDVALYISMSPQIFLDTASQYIGEIFHREIDQYHSFAFISFSALRDMFPKRDHFLMCDIGGEITDVSLVKDNMLMETVSFPKGRMTMMRDMVSSLKRPPEEVLSMLTLYFDGLQREDAQSSTLSGLVEKNKNAWLSSFREAMEELGSRNFLSSDIEITAHPIMGRWIGSALSQAPFHLGAMGGDEFKLNAHFIDASFLRKFVSFKDIGQFDSFLALEALFAEKMLNLAVETV